MCRRCSAGTSSGHEFIGEVVEVGDGAKEKLRVGDRVCGAADDLVRVVLLLQAGAVLALRQREPGRGAGGGAVGALAVRDLRVLAPPGRLRRVARRDMRVPYADTGPVKIPDGFGDTQALLCSDAFPTGYFAADLCAPRWRGRGGLGAGAVGLFAIASARLLGAERVIAIERMPERIRLARERAGATDVLDYSEVDVVEELKALTGGRGPDACIDAVGWRRISRGSRAGTTGSSRRPVSSRSARTSSASASRPVARAARCR
jgi:threonine dehydrogenase-like Zn-dependent dehydrogenase